MGDDSAVGVPLLYLAIIRLVYQKWVSSALLISIVMIASITIGETFAAGKVAFIMAINFLAILLSAAGVLTPVSGALIHNAGSVPVALNSALLYNWKFD